MQRTKIDWADYTWNPITGCLYDCEYCYARKQSARFSGDVRVNMIDERCKKYNGKENLFVLETPFVTRSNRSISYPFGFAPTFHKYRLSKLNSIKNGANIFVCSMSDMFGKWVPDEWIEMIFKACLEHPKNNYIFLTKNPSRYLELAKNNKLPKGDNMWYGTTVTHEDMPYFFAEEHNCFLSIEPILTEFATENELIGIDWVIVGAETGNRKNKVICQKFWIDNLAKICNKNNIPLFMKESLMDLMGNKFSQEFPFQLSKEKLLSDKKEKLLMDRCMECKLYSRKSDMFSVTLRKGRQGKNKTIGYLCDTCIGNLSKKWGINDYEQ